jgi:hypothetical protein
MDLAVVRALKKLRSLPVALLQIRYRQLMGEESKSAHKEYLLRRIAWQMQAQAESGLSERALGRIVELADDSLIGPAPQQKGFLSRSNDTKPNSVSLTVNGPRDERLPAPGTLLRRRYQGNEVVVQVLEEGFEYQSRRYRSLSAIAREVTGTRWNGLLFFGLTERRHG